MSNGLGQIRVLIESAPDKAIRELGFALGSAVGGEAIDDVRDMVRTEARDRACRDAVLGPLRPMFGLRADALPQLTFPTAALGPMWRAIKAIEPDMAARALIAASQDTDPAAWPKVYDQLCARLAECLRDPPDVAMADVVARLGDKAPQLATCLEVAALARAAMPRLHDWLQRMSEERAVTARLAFRDAVNLCDGGGVAWFEILYSNLEEPWELLRLIASVMGRPSDAFLAGTELCVFGERLLADIDRRLDKMRHFDADMGARAGRDLGVDMRIISAVVEEFEASLNLSREGPWGARLNKQKTLLAKSAEGFLKRIDKALALALPMAPVRLGGRTIRQAPKLDVPPSELQMQRAEAMLILIEQVRSAAVKGGYNALRVQVSEQVEHRLTSYAEELIDAIHNGEPDDAPNARLYLDRVADLTAHVMNEEAAQIVRRRAAAA